MTAEVHTRNDDLEPGALPCLLDPGSRDHRRVLYQYAHLRREITVWQYQAAGGLPGRLPDLETKLRARIERIQTLLDPYATLEVQGV